MLPDKKATSLAHSFVTARPHLADSVMSDLDTAAARKIAKTHGINPTDFLLEVEAEIDWLAHRVPT